MAPRSFSPSSPSRRLTARLSFAATVAVLVLPSAAAPGEPGHNSTRARLPPNASLSTPVRRPVEPWTARFARIDDDIRRGRPLVTFVIVPLCSNDQINCGSTPAGRPGNLKTNLYWGAVFGMRRFFDRKHSGWTRIELTQGTDQGFVLPNSQALSGLPEGVLLERAVYRRQFDRDDASGKGDAPGEQIVVLQAIHGSEIDHAISLFWSLATTGGRIRFQDGQRIRDERIHVAGYAGHNRLMDGIHLPAVATKHPNAGAIPSFVMACESDAYFSRSLRQAGSDPLVMTRALMAPEGYVVDAIVQALGDNAALPAIRARTVDAYAKWQRLSTGVASSIFALPRPPPALDGEAGS
jgi:hypothetical protein